MLRKQHCMELQHVDMLHSHAGRGPWPAHPD